MDDKDGNVKRIVNLRIESCGLLDRHGHPLDVRVVLRFDPEQFFLVSVSNLNFN